MKWSWPRGFRNSTLELEQMEDAINRADAINARQQEGFKGVRGVRARRKELRRGWRSCR